MEVWLTDVCPSCWLLVTADSSHFQIVTLTVAPCHVTRLSLHPSPHPTPHSHGSAVPACNAPARHTNPQTCRVRQVGTASRSVTQKKASPHASELQLHPVTLSFILVLWTLLLLPAPASGITSAPSFHPAPSSSTPRGPFPFHPHPATLQTRDQGNKGVGFSLAEVHQELQMLQKQLGDNDSALVELYVHECVLKPALN